MRWGLPVPPTCLLCNIHDESIQQLFFDCVFSSEVWSFFSSRANVSPPICFEQGLRWLKSPSYNSNMALIFRLSFQASLYVLRKERNSRLHTQAAKSPFALIFDTKNTIRFRLDPLSRAQRVVPPNVSYLATWLDLFQPSFPFFFCFFLVKPAFVSLVFSLVIIFFCCRSCFCISLCWALVVLSF